MTDELFKCVVAVGKLRMERIVDGKQVFNEGQDINGGAYKFPEEVTYVKGDELFLPKERIEQLGKSVELVLEPVAVAPVTKKVSDSDDEEEDEDEKSEPTVADLLPKEKPKTNKGKGKGKGNGKKDQ